MKYLFSTVFLLFLSACQSAISVKPIASSVAIQHACIEENTKAEVQDFLQVVRDGFDRNGIPTEVYTGIPPANCEYKVTYTATNRWELLYGVFLAHATIRIEKEGRYVAAATYDFSSGFSSAKSHSTRENMDPLIDEMLKKQK